MSGVSAREINSAWELAPRRRAHSVDPAFEGKHDARCAAVAEDRDRSALRGVAVHGERKAHVHVDPTIVDDVREALGELGGEAPAAGCAAPLGELTACDTALGARALLIAANPAGWQRCLHGNDTMLREEVTRAVLAEHGSRSAFRYAACGLGDVLVHDGRGVHVAPKGCGHRLCPRCGRTKGRPMIKRIFGWLAAVAHGDIFTMCLTQRVRSGESLAQARGRMTPVEQEYLAWLKDLGMISAASCAHPIWSESGRGWHYHVHLLIEMPGSWRSQRGRRMTPRRLRAMYRLLRWGQSVQAKGPSASCVVTAGAPDPGLVSGACDPDFWTEQKSGLAAAVQYPVRDIAQGISAKRMGGDRDQVAACVAELLTKGKGWKLRRTMGQWRKKPPEVAPPPPVAGAEETAKPAPPPGGKPVVFGTVHRCSRLAVKGDHVLQGVFRLLEASNRNDTDFGKRFLTFCRCAAARGQT